MSEKRVVNEYVLAFGVFRIAGACGMSMDDVLAARERIPSRCSQDHRSAIKEARRKIRAYAECEIQKAVDQVLVERGYKRPAIEDVIQEETARFDAIIKETRGAS